MIRNGPARAAWNMSVDEALLECAADLTELQKDALHQRYYENTPVRRIAEIWGRTQMAVYKVLNRVHESLAECMRGKLNLAPRT